MTALEQADALQHQAIALLLAERRQIDERLAQLGHGDEKASAARRGRPPKKPETLSQSKTLSPALPLLEPNTGSNTPDQSSSPNI
ncbi:MAG: hypothetical protein ABR910_00025 [Acidobacteriaceae bacterium]|jgi:hypothetical protein